MVYGVQLKNREISKDLMFMLSLSETMDQLAMTISVHWYGHVLRRADGHFLEMALYFHIESGRKKGISKST